MDLSVQTVTESLTNDPKQLPANLYSIRAGINNVCVIPGVGWLLGPPAGPGFSVVLLPEAGGMGAEGCEAKPGWDEHRWLHGKPRRRWVINSRWRVDIGMHHRAHNYERHFEIFVDIWRLYRTLPDPSTHENIQRHWRSPGLPLYRTPLVDIEHKGPEPTPCLQRPTLYPQQDRHWRLDYGSGVEWHDRRKLRSRPS